MKIKRYVAPTMREAIAQVREEQGPEAVILSNRRIDEGMEVIAAIDYDESLMSQAIAQIVPRAQRSAVMPPMQREESEDAAIARVRAQLAPTEQPAKQPAQAAKPAAAVVDQDEDVAVEISPAATSRRNAEFAAAMRDASKSKGAVAAVERAAGISKVATASAQNAVKAQPRASGPAAAKTNIQVAVPANARPSNTADTKPTAQIKAAASAQPTSQPVLVLPSEVSRAEKQGLSAILPDAAISSVRDEVQNLRSLLESQLASLAWNDMGRRQPLKAKVLRDLTALDIAPEIAREIVDEMPSIENLRDSWKVPLGLLLKRIPVTDDGILEHGGVVAVVGPTGVGKTTTIAKIAARFALKHGAHHVALVSTDTYRIGAREQLLTYARILGVSMHVAQDANELASALNQLEMKKLVLIDTAGMSQRDLRLNEQFATLHNDRARIRVLLALSASAEYSALEETVRVFERIRPSACVLTKLDEAASLGAPLSIAIRHGLAIAHLCDGQRVPEDLHPAFSRRSWLVQTAMKMRRDSQRVADESVLAEQFGKVAAHA